MWRFTWRGSTFRHNSYQPSFQGPCSPVCFGSVFDCPFRETLFGPVGEHTSLGGVLGQHLSTPRQQADGPPNPAHVGPCRKGPPGRALRRLAARACHLCKLQSNGLRGPRQTMTRHPRCAYLDPVLPHALIAITAGMREPTLLFVPKA